MADSEKLDLLLSEMQGMKADMQGIKAEMQGMKAEIQGIKTDMQGMKIEIKNLKDSFEILEVKHDLTHKKLDDLTLDVKVTERAIKKDIKLLQDSEETLITVLENQGILLTAK